MDKLHPTTKSERFLTKKKSKFVPKNVVLHNVLFSFCLLLIIIHYLVNSDIEFTVNRAVYVKLTLVTSCIGHDIALVVL